MRCERVQLFYEDYARGDAEPALLAEMDEHLAECAACRRYFEESDRVADLIRTHHEVAHPGPSYFADLNARVLAELDAGPKAAVRPAGSLAKVRRPLWWAGSAAAAALAAMAVLPDLLPAPVSDPSVSSVPAPSAVYPKIALLRQDKAIPQKTSRAVARKPETLELILPVLDMASGGITTLVATQPAARSAATTLYKSVMGLDESDGLRELLAQSEGDALRYEDTGAAPLPSAPAQPAIEQVKMEPPAARVTTRTGKTAPRLDAAAMLDSALAHEAAGAETAAAMTARLRDFEKTIGRNSDRLDAGGAVLAKQARLYLEAEEALSRGDDLGAGRLYRRILLVDGDTALAQRAQLRTADLASSQWADFAVARDAYEQCLRGAGEHDALSADERLHAGRQLDRLARHQDGNWRALSLVHGVKTEPWPQALAALRSLCADPAAGDLMPEAARAAVERAKTGGADDATAVEIHRALDERAARESAPEVRAWLEIEIGDLDAARFKDDNQALLRYRKAADIGAGTDAGRAAKLRVDELPGRADK